MFWAGLNHFCEFGESCTCLYRQLGFQALLSWYTVPEVHSTLHVTVDVQREAGKIIVPQYTTQRYPFNVFIFIMSSLKFPYVGIYICVCVCVCVYLCIYLCIYLQKMRSHCEREKETRDRNEEKERHVVEWGKWSPRIDYLIFNALKLEQD